MDKSKFKVGDVVKLKGSRKAPEMVIIKEDRNFFVCRYFRELDYTFPTEYFEEFELEMVKRSAGLPPM